MWERKNKHYKHGYGKEINNDCVKPLKYQGLSTVAVSMAYTKTNMNVIDYFFLTN